MQWVHFRRLHSCPRVWLHTCGTACGRRQRPPASLRGGRCQHQGRMFRPLCLGQNSVRTSSKIMQPLCMRCNKTQRRGAALAGTAHLLLAAAAAAAAAAGRTAVVQLGPPLSLQDIVRGAFQKRGRRGHGLYTECGALQGHGPTPAAVPELPACCQLTLPSWLPCCDRIRPGDAVRCQMNRPLLCCCAFTLHDDGNPSSS